MSARRRPFVTLPALVALASSAGCLGSGPSAEAPADAAVLPVVRELRLAVSAAQGSDDCLGCAAAGCACGTPARPVASLMAAQQLADAFVERVSAEAAGSGATRPPMHVEIRASGVFHGQWLRWRHPHRDVALTLRSAPGERAVFFGGGHPCQSALCFTEDRPRDDDGRPPTFAPVACASSEGAAQHCATAGVASYVGYTFFAAQGGTGWFQDHYRDYTGFGAIRIEGIDVREYHTAIRVTGWSAAEVRERGEPGTRDDAVDAPVEGMVVADCHFERIGEIANNVASDDPRVMAMADAYTAIALTHVHNSAFHGNVFADIVNYGSWTRSKILMHAIYTKQSDQNVYVGNTFRNVSGQPIKFRHTSDRNLVVGNLFEAGGDSVTRAPVQDWYCDWQNVGGNAECARTELPSFENTLSGNTYRGGYLADLRSERSEFIAIACPSEQSPGGSYDVMRACAGTRVRMLVEGLAFECVPADGTHESSASPLNAHLLRGSAAAGLPVRRETCSAGRCQALVAAASSPAEAECPRWD